ncbi:MAG: WXG100 family type VII secretion target [Acutalibacteraceae bacterium]
MALPKDYVTLDTRAFHEAKKKMGDFVQTYAKLNETYDEIVKNLLNDWKGNGAESFYKDATQIKRNISGIYDILKAMFDTLEDCEAIFEKSDKALGDYNRTQSNPTEG